MIIEGQTVSFGWDMLRIKWKVAFELRKLAEKMRKMHF